MESCSKKGYSVQIQKILKKKPDIFFDIFSNLLMISPLPWLGDLLAEHWFRMRDLDKTMGTDRANAALVEFVGTNDFDHWTALNVIASRLQRERTQFPPTLADWAATLHSDLAAGNNRIPPKERGNQGDPPYAMEMRNRLFDAADQWLKYYGMKKGTDRLDAIAKYTGDDAEIVKKGIAKFRQGTWRRAPWPWEPAPSPNQSGEAIRK